MTAPRKRRKQRRNSTSTLMAVQDARASERAGGRYEAGVVATCFGSADVPDAIAFPSPDVVAFPTGTMLWEGVACLVAASLGFGGGGTVFSSWWCLRQSADGLNLMRR